MRMYITKSVYNGTCVIIMSAQSLNGKGLRLSIFHFSSIKNPLPAKLIQGSRRRTRATRPLAPSWVLRC